MEQYDYSDTQLPDDEMTEFLHHKHLAEIEEAKKERERIRKRDSFRWKGGMP